MSSSGPIDWKDIVDRQTGLLTPAQNRVIRNSKVLILGLGGMGMGTAAQLARLGFERFTLVDFDHVESTNANRTPFSFDDTVGLQKVDATKKYLLKINPGAKVRTFPHIKLGLDSDPELIGKLVKDNDVLCWAMDGMQRLSNRR